MLEETHKNHLKHLYQLHPQTLEEQTSCMEEEEEEPVEVKRHYLLIKEKRSGYLPKIV